MTDEIYDKASKIKGKINDLKTELKIYRKMTYKYSHLKMLPTFFRHDEGYFSDFVKKYIVRDDIKAEIIKLMEEEIQKLEKEYEEL